MKTILNRNRASITRDKSSPNFFVNIILGYLTTWFCPAFWCSDTNRKWPSKLTIMFEDGTQLPTATLYISSNSRKIESGDCSSMLDSSIEVRFWMSRPSCMTWILLLFMKLTNWPCHTHRVHGHYIYNCQRPKYTWFPNNAVYLNIVSSLSSWEYVRIRSNNGLISVRVIQ